MNPAPPPTDCLVELTGVILPASPLGGAAGTAIDWCLRAGDYWVVGGLHGSGKSQLIAVAGGLQPPASGTVRWFSEKVADLKEEELLRHRRRIAVVFDRGGRVFNQLSVFENIALPLRYHHNGSHEQAEPKVEAMIGLLELGSCAHQTPRSLNQSWQLRVGLARALVMQPEVLLIDNPFLGLEFRHRQWWIDFLRQASAGAPFTGGTPMTIVVTTDHFHPWLEAGKQFAVLKNRHWHVLGSRAELAEQRQEGMGHLEFEEI